MYFFMASALPKMSKCVEFGHEMANLATLLHGALLPDYKPHCRSFFVTYDHFDYRIVTQQICAASTLQPFRGKPLVTKMFITMQSSMD